MLLPDRQSYQPPRSRLVIVGTFRPALESDSKAVLVMPGLVPGIHVLILSTQGKTWMAGTKPGHDGNDSFSERPLILLVAPIAVVQAPGYLLAHRWIAGDRDREALLGDNLAASCLDREVS